MDDLEFTDLAPDERLFDSVPDEIVFTDQQKEALKLLKEFADCLKPVFRFSGYSGTGKSFTIGQFAKWYRAEYPDKLIAAIAPSHKAKKNLEVMLEGVKNVDTSTIASFLKLAPVLDETTGKEYFRESESSKINDRLPEDYDLVICDEYSMIDKQTTLALLSKCQKIIYVGDPAQLPPIGEDLSHVVGLKCPSYQLTKVVRYSGDLARIAESWRDEIVVDIDNNTRLASLPNLRVPLPIESTDDGSIVQLKKIDWVEKFSNEVFHSIQSNDPYHCKIIVYMNKTADKWNSWVRSEIWDNDEPYCVGDRLLCKKPLFRKVSRKHYERFEIVVPNSTEFTVIGNYQYFQLEIGKLIYDYHSVPCKDDDGMKMDLFILTPESKSIRDKNLKSMFETAKNTIDSKAKKQLWYLYYLLQQSFDDVSFAYAITTHKAQGSTYNMLFPDIADMMKCPTRKKMIYTGLTRSKKAFIYK